MAAAFGGGSAMTHEPNAAERLLERLEDLEHGIASARMVKLTLRMITEEVKEIKTRLEALEEVEARR